MQVTSDGAFHDGSLDLHVYVPLGLPIQDPEPEHVVSAASAPGAEISENALRVFKAYPRNQKGGCFSRLQ